MIDQVEQSHQARPGTPSLCQPLTTSATGPAIQLLTQAVNTVGVLVNTVIYRQQATGFGEQGDDATHDDARTGHIQIAVVEENASFFGSLNGAMRSGDEFLYRQTGTLSKDRRQLGLSLARIEDGGQQRTGGFATRREQH